MDVDHHTLTNRMEWINVDKKCLSYTLFPNQSIFLRNLFISFFRSLYDQKTISHSFISCDIVEIYVIEQ